MATNGKILTIETVPPAGDLNRWVSELRAGVKGRVILPGEPGYAESTTLFYGGFDQRPAVVVRPLDAQDAAWTILTARQHGVELAVRSGGHSVAGLSLSDGGIVLDLRDMRALQIDPASRTAWAETGLTAGEYTAAAAGHGLATGFGDTGSVGIGGITLGGGVGYLVRKHGLTIDSLLAAEVVTAGGQIFQVDEDYHPDLFWAVRGGGGNFGVVTRFQYRLHEVDRVLGGMLILPATAEVIAGFLAEAETAPEELSTIANVMPAPPMPLIPQELHGQMILMAMLVYAGDPEEGQRVVAPFRQLAAPLADMVQPMRYVEMFQPEEGGFHPSAVSRTLFTGQVDRDKAQMILDTLEASDAPMRIAQLRVLGGAAARVPEDATAYAHRKSRIMVNLAAFYTSPADKLAREDWVERFAQAVDPSGGAYVNFLGEEGRDHIRDAYPGTTYDRLAAVKARYDPTNFFRRNHNISPAAAELGQTRSRRPGMQGPDVR